MKNMKEQFRQINAVIEILKDARPLCEDPETTGLVESALEGAETLQHMMVEGEWPCLAGIHLSGEPGLPSFLVDPFPEDDVAELCFPV
jgi:hypothetical protein